MTKNFINSNQTKDQNKQIILDVVKSQKPETIQQLIAILEEKFALPPELITNLLIELENEDKFHFTKKGSPLPRSFQDYLFSKNAVWYWFVVALSLATTIAIFVIPESAFPIVYVRSGLSLIFVLVLPGYAFIKMLFLSQTPIKTSSESMDTVERVALSFGMSLVLVPVVVLILNYTPWGIRITPITLSLLALTIVFATAAVLREYQTKIQLSKSAPKP